MRLIKKDYSHLQRLEAGICPVNLNYYVTMVIVLEHNMYTTGDIAWVSQARISINIWSSWWEVNNIIN